METSNLQNLTTLAGRAMLAAMFLVAGFGKIGAYAGTQAYMVSFGFSGFLLPAVIGLEILGGLAILFGIQARVAAVLLAGFTLLAAVIFHSDFGQPMQSILFMKNLAISGALLMLAAQGPGEWVIGARTKLSGARS